MKKNIATVYQAKCQSCGQKISSPEDIISRQLRKLISRYGVSKVMNVLHELAF